jgi:hypothetical protein
VRLQQGAEAASLRLFFQERLGGQLIGDQAVDDETLDGAGDAGEYFLALGDGDDE